MANTKRKDLIYPDQSYKLFGLFFQIHNELGRFRIERQYCDRLAELLKENNISFTREKDLKYNFDNVDLKGNIPDFLIYNLIIVDFKHKPFLTKADYYQIMRYLEIANLPLGILVNFRANYLSPKRVINPKYSDNSVK